MVEKKYRIRQDETTGLWHIEYTRLGFDWTNLGDDRTVPLQRFYTSHKSAVVAFGIYTGIVGTHEAFMCMMEEQAKMIHDALNLSEAEGKQSGEPKMLFQRKPTVVEAMQFTYENKNTVFRWASQLQGNVTAGWTGEEHKSEPRLLIPTREGIMACDLGDWVVRESHPCKDSSRNIYPIKDEIFRELYEAVDPTAATMQNSMEAIHGNHAGTVYG